MLVALALLGVAAYSPAPAPIALRQRSPPPTLSVASEDNLLPPSGTKLDDFLALMNKCYCGAGLAHAIDFATGNALPAAAGLEPFALLPPAGQALGVLWVLIGVLQPLAQTRAAQQAAVAAYGVYEIILTLAAQLATTDPDGLATRLGAAAGVQLVVGFCYFELRRQSIEAAAEEGSAAGERSRRQRRAHPTPWTIASRRISRRRVMRALHELKVARGAHLMLELE